MQARTQFITPFFRALGWDVENAAGRPYREMEVLEEKGPGEGRPDYTFRVGGLPKFFVEAKAPHVTLSGEHVLQVKRYAWSTKEVFAVILTDFEEFRFYDASLEPDTNHPHHGELIHLRYTEYLANLHKLWDFSPERVAAGSIEALLPRDKRALRHRKFVDERFLEDMTRWRADLAKAIHKHNPGLDSQTLSSYVQRLLDRMVFIRVAEDRRIMEPRSLRERVEDWQAMGGRKPLLPMLNDLFQQVNEDFNGEIFRPHDSENIKLDSWAIGKIIQELYPPKSPYRFDVIPIDLLGSIYERYLGKVIHVKGKRVEVEDKPEVRKAGGVYYTPKYIVDYIVAHTVGKLIEGKTPRQIEKIKILDPACGSGSFLIGAFQQLIDYHVAYYQKHPKEARTHPLYPELMKNGNGTHRLSIHRKAKILRHNLFGLDLDPQAVEITMMNLYLKALEAERDLPHKQALLPELKFNIRCGNSLIAPDIAQEQPLTQKGSRVAPVSVAPASRRWVSKQEQKLSPEDWQRLRPFDWHSKTDGFGDILAPPQSFGAGRAAADSPSRFAGGFDAVIGNPPYVRMEGFKELKAYLRRTFASHDERTDLYVYFVERSHGVLKAGGRFGMILSNKFLRAGYGKKLREYLRTHATIERLVDFAGLPVFVGATVRPVVLVSSKDGTPRPTVYAPPPALEKFEALAGGSMSVEQAVAGTDYEVPPNAFAREVWTFERKDESSLLAKLQERSVPLVHYCPGQIFMGVKSGFADAFVVHEETKTRILRRNPRAAEVIKPFLNGRDIRRYEIRFNGTYLLYTYHGIDISKYPAVERHLKPFRKGLLRRATKQAWYELQQPQFNFAKYMDAPKIIFPDIATSPRFALDDTGYYGANTTYFIPRRDFFLLALLNSRVGHFYFTNTCAGLEGKKETYLRFFGQYLENFPVCNTAVKHLREKLARLAEQMGVLASKLRKARTQADRQALEHELDATDREINQLVYQLYGLTPEEIALVESSMSASGERR